MDYPFENLGPERFQEFCQALLVKMHPKVQCFPIGQPDGGRDALLYFSIQDGDFIVFQVKFTRKPLSIPDPHKWLIEILHDEAPKVKNLIPNGAKGYFLLTNVPGTAHPDVGSIDQVANILKQIGIPAICFWREDLSRHLDTAWDLKWVYPELMTGPDLIRAFLETGLKEHQQRRQDTIKRFLRDQYEIDLQVRFKQVELQNDLLSLFIDVPVSYQGGGPKQNLGQVLSMVSANLNRQKGTESRAPREVYASLPGMPSEYWHVTPKHEPTGAASFLLHPIAQSLATRVVLEGAPGQGKSTIVQYISQIHRMRLLGKGDELTRIPENHRNVPVRIPFKVDLRDLSTWLNKRDPFSASDDQTPPAQWHKSLEAFLAAQVRHHSGGNNFDNDDLVAIARISAILLVFDGLDEVADIGRRQEVVEEIIKGINRLEESAASLQVVVTSRPAAFANSPGLPETTFPYFQLESVTPTLIEEYANRWLKARNVEPRQAVEVKRILREKLDQPHLRDLARNPMQLAILLSLIHTRGSSLPDKRTALYDSYIELFFNRESEKSEIVREHRDLLIDVHRYLAWILHSEAEQGQDRGSVSSERLQKLVTEYLSGEGHDSTLADKLFTGMVERVVAVVSRVEGTYEFEVQPLREYFAARYLYDTAPYSPPGNEKRGTKPDRFDAIARDFYWLNVTRFYSGCYSKGELPSLVDRIQELAKSPGYKNTSHPRVLGATLLSDWVFAQHPKSVKEVVDLILDPRGLRPIVSLGKRLSPANTFVLPQKCGREDLVRKCFDILRTSPPNDFALSVIDLIKANSTPQEIEPLWLREAAATEKQDRSRWIRYGVRLEALSRVAASDLKALLQDTPMDDQRLRHLYRARRFDQIDSNVDYAEGVLRMILQREIEPPSHRTDSILDVAFHCLDVRRYALAFRFRQPAPLKDIWDRFGDERFARLSTEDLAPDCEASPIFAKCRDLARLAETESERGSFHWATTLSPWNNLVEKARSLWGDRWILNHLATVSCGIKSNQETGKEFNRLFRKEDPLCSRARYARLRATASSSAWWNRQLFEIQTESDAMFACLMVLTWGSAKTLTELATAIGQTLEGLTGESWAAVIASAREIQSRVARPTPRSLYTLQVQSLPTDLSPRTAVAFATRTKQGHEIAVYDKYLKNYDGNDHPVLEFCQAQAFQLARVASLPWNQALKIIRESYGRGVIGLHLAQQLRNVSSGVAYLPPQVADEIVENADKYPGLLVTAAETRCRATVAKSIVPVGKVAARQGWFNA